MIIKGPNYPCLISHTDRSDKKERWKSILNLHLKNAIYLFESFDAVELRTFIAQSNEEIATNYLVWGNLMVNCTKNEIFHLAFL